MNSNQILNITSAKLVENRIITENRQLVDKEYVDTAIENIENYYTKSARYTNFGNILPTATSYKTLITKAGTIVQWAVWSKESATVTLAIKINGTSIVGSGTKPYLTAETQRISTPSGWTSVAVAVGDELEYVIDSNDNSTELFVELKITY